MINQQQVASYRLKEDPPGSAIDEGIIGYNKAIDDVVEMMRRYELATVNERAETLYPDRTFDTALPQRWVDGMQARGFDPRGHFVTLYPTGSILGFYMAPITDTGIEMAARVASMEA